MTTEGAATADACVMRRRRRIIIALCVVLAAIAGLWLYAYLTSGMFVYRRLAALVIEVEHRAYIKSAHFSVSRNPTTGFDVRLIDGLETGQVEQVGRELMDSLDSLLYYGMDEALRGRINVGDIMMILHAQNAGGQSNGLSCMRRIQFAELTPQTVSWTVYHPSTQKYDAEITSPYGHTLPRGWPYN